MKNLNEIIFNNTLFYNISKEDIELLLKDLNAEKKHYLKNETIFYTDETIKDFGIVLSGTINIIKEDFDGNNTLLVQVKRGEMFAEAFVFGELPLTVLAEAAEETHVLWINYKNIFNGRHDNYDSRFIFISNLMKAFAKKTVFLTRRIEHLSKRTIKEKVLSYLNEQSGRQKKHNFDIPLNRQELADYLSVDRSALSAVLSKLKDEGVIDFHKNNFKLT